VVYEPEEWIGTKVSWELKQEGGYTIVPFNTKVGRGRWSSVPAPKTRMIFPTCSVEMDSPSIMFVDGGQETRALKVAPTNSVMSLRIVTNPVIIPNRR
jgi:hypothetical protein